MMGRDGYDVYVLTDVNKLITLAGLLETEHTAYHSFRFTLCRKLKTPL